MERFLGIFVLVALVAVPIVLLWGKRAYDRASAASLSSIYARAQRQARAFGPSTPTVSIAYHTYSGILVYVEQAEHQFTLPARVAEDTLSALLKHTLKYGFFAYGALFIPVLAYCNYLGQRRSIAKQEAASGSRLGQARAAGRR